MISQDEMLIICGIFLITGVAIKYILKYNGSCISRRSVNYF